MKIKKIMKMTIKVKKERIMKKIMKKMIKKNIMRKKQDPSVNGKL